MKIYTVHSDHFIGKNILENLKYFADNEKFSKQWPDLEVFPDINDRNPDENDIAINKTNLELESIDGKSEIYRVFSIFIKRVIDIIGGIAVVEIALFLAKKYNLGRVFFALERKLSGKNVEE